MLTDAGLDLGSRPTRFATDDGSRTIRAGHQHALCDGPTAADVPSTNGAVALSTNGEPGKSGSIQPAEASGNSERAKVNPPAAPAADTMSSNAASRERTEAEWRQALADKDERFRDLHHRVKNSLQLISSLLSIETRGIKDLEAAQRLQDAQRRIQTLVRVHERLYELNDGCAGRIDAGAQLSALCRDLAVLSGAVDRGVTIAIEAQPCSIDRDKLTPLALLVSELVTNAVKHATPPSHTDIPIQVKVTLGRDTVEGYARLSVSDSGPGLPADFDLAHCRGLGMRLVTSFARQLGGTLSIEHTQTGNNNALHGACFSVSFPLNR
jgi:two-component sensor histidine kinase